MESKTQAVIVTDPDSGRNFDLKPVLDILDITGFGSPEHAFNELSNAFEFIAMNATISEPWQQAELKSVLWHIKLVKDMFHNITELQPRLKRA